MFADAQDTGERLQTAARGQHHALVACGNDAHHQNGRIALLDDEACLGGLESYERHALALVSRVDRS
jgi:hypothetical protein